jgi:hypothetical protein
MAKARMGNKTKRKSASGLSDEALNELGRRLGAAYASYFAGYKGVDRLLRQTEDVGAFWKELADLVSVAIREGGEEDQRLRDILSKYVQ